MTRKETGPKLELSHTMMRLGLHPPAICLAHARELIFL